MKKILFTFCLLLFSFSFAQSSTYRKQIEDLATKFSTAKTVAQYDSLFEKFDILKKNSDTYRWKSYYYAGLAMYRKAELLLNSNNRANASEANSIANKYILGSQTAQPHSQEMQTLIALINEQHSKLNR